MFVYVTSFQCRVFSCDRLREGKGLGLAMTVIAMVLSLSAKVNKSTTDDKLPYNRDVGKKSYQRLKGERMSCWRLKKEKSQILCVSSDLQKMFV